MRRLICISVLALVGCQQDSPTVQTPSEVARLAAASMNNVVGTQIEPVALIRGPMPTGLAVSHTGRLFVTFPRWGDPVEFTVAEIQPNQAVPYPNIEFNRLNTNDPKNSLISVQSVVVDA